MQVMTNLLQQLTSSFKPLTSEKLEEIISSQNTHLYIARDSASDNRIIGTLTLVFYRIPTGLNARIEDVVVDSLERGKGVGEKLMRLAIKNALDAEAEKIDLTSTPKRHAAIRLYLNLGFKLSNNGTYRYKQK
jgi:GNAT superfamily N-acetyltransferase